MKKLFWLPLLVACCWAFLGAPAAARARAVRPTYLQLSVYHLRNAQQVEEVEAFLQQHYLPTLHAAGIPLVGVFKPIGNDTATDKKIYVLTPFASLRQWEKARQHTAATLLAGHAYAGGPNRPPAYDRQEHILLKTFADMGELAAPSLDAPPSARVYELRSYESASEPLFRNKVQMFNAGGEIKLFARLGFHSLFYGEVLFGSKMPNLMYMTTFASLAAREAHWQAFGSDPEWKRLAALPEYQNNVSHIDITFLRPTTYSDL